jgi:hypothetical protein
VICEVPSLSGTGGGGVVLLVFTSSVLFLCKRLCGDVRRCSGVVNHPPIAGAGLHCPIYALR